MWWCSPERFAIDEGAGLRLHRLPPPGRRAIGTPFLETGSQCKGSGTLTMAKIEVYSSMLCPYCYRAKKLLEQKGADFTEIDVMLNPRRKAEMVQRSGGRTSVPQIFIGDRHVGGCDELFALDAGNKLDPLLQAVG